MEVAKQLSKRLRLMSQRSKRRRPTPKWLASAAVILSFEVRSALLSEVHAALTERYGEAAAREAIDLAWRPLVRRCLLNMAGK